MATATASSSSSNSSSSSSSSNATAFTLAPHVNVSVNECFSSKRKRIKLTGAVQRDTPQETKHTLQSNNKDRKLYLQAVTVRVMKMRKQLMYSQLIREIIDQCQSRFRPNVPLIKKCIEDLIDKGYMERSQDDKTKLYYVA